MTTNDDLPVLRDPLFKDALLICITNKSASTSLLQRHLRVGYGRAAALLDAMVQVGYIGELDGSKRARPVLISSAEELERRIAEAEERDKKEHEISEAELMRLLNSDEYLYIKQFAKKYGKNINADELLKLQDLLNSRGFVFSSERVTGIVNYVFNQQRYRDAKSKILNENPSEVRDIIKAYLNFYRPEDDEMFEVLKGIIEEKDSFDSFENDPEELKKEVKMIEREIELEVFEKRLLTDDAEKKPALADLDGFGGYEFESFLKDLFSKMGYRVEQTKLSGDQGADLVVIKFGEKTVIQAKRYGAKVGNYAVQEIMAAISLYKAQQGMVVTNNYFTSAAAALAGANNIELVDRDALEELINKHW